MLSAFVVTNTGDQRKLFDILKSLQCDNYHTIVCQSKEPRYNVQSIPGHFTVCDAITVENSLVFNCLIDQTGMERTLLVHDEQDCKNYFGYSNGLEGFKENGIKVALTEKATRIEFKAGNMVNYLRLFKIA